MNQMPRRALRLVPAEPEAGGRLRVAIATRDTRHANEPFGRASAFAIYDVCSGTSRLAAIVEFDLAVPVCPTANDNQDLDACLGHIDARVAVLAGCHLLFTCAIGTSAAARAMAAGIHPLVVAKGEPITALLGRCQAMLSGNPPPWIRRVMAGTAAGAAAERPDGTESFGGVPIGANRALATGAAATG